MGERANTMVCGGMDKFSVRGGGGRWTSPDYLWMVTAKGEGWPSPDYPRMVTLTLASMDTLTWRGKGGHLRTSLDYPRAIVDGPMRHTGVYVDTEVTFTSMDDSGLSHCKHKLGVKVTIVTRGWVRGKCRQ